MQFPVTIPLRRSVLLRTAIFFVHALAILSVFLVAISLLWQIILAFFLIFCAYQSTKDAQLTPFSILYLSSKNRLQALPFALAEQPENRLSLQVLPSTFIFPWFLVLHLREAEEGKIYYCCVVADQLLTPQKDHFRQLKLWLKSQHTF